MNVNLPYSEYWIPLAIGLGVGFLAILIIRSLMPTPTYQPKEDDPRFEVKSKDYDPFEQGSRSESRRSFRRAGNPIRVYFATPDNKSHPSEGWVIDRSMGGLCMGVPIEVQAGTILSILPINAPPMTPWVDIEVRSCRLMDDQYELGCQFVKVPPWSVLLLFG